MYFPLFQFRNSKVQRNVGYQIYKADLHFLRHPIFEVSIYSFQNANLSANNLNLINSLGSEISTDWM